MSLPSIWIWITYLIFGTVAQSTQGILDLVQRRLPDHVDDFEFRLLASGTGNSSRPVNDNYVISSTTDAKILVQGNSLSALSSG